MPNTVSRAPFRPYIYMDLPPHTLHPFSYSSRVNHVHCTFTYIPKFCSFRYLIDTDVFDKSNERRNALLNHILTISHDYI